ncbi:MAG: hypothetical protein HWN67_12020 [Candidatus Helarchaeota archaeon]|nr:hypothetical protein [Candidatus Helarchaeota archaeon]
MDKITEVWIIENSGLCLFNHAIESKIDEILFSGFLSGIRTFLEEIGEKKLERLELGHSKLIFYNLDEFGLFIVLKSPKKTKDKYLEKKINEVTNKFVNLYGDQLLEHQKKKMPYNTEDFKDFRKTLEDDIFKENIEKNISSWLKSI